MPPAAPACDAAYWVARIGELEARKRIEKMRGLPTRTRATQLTAARKRLRSLLGGADVPAEIRRDAERILGLAAQHAQNKGYPSNGPDTRTATAGV